MYLLQTTIDVPAAVRHVGQFASRSAVRDPDFVLKTVMTDALGGPLLRPWTRRAQNGPSAVIVAYSETDPEACNRRLAFALPSARAAVGDVLGYRLPPLAAGDRLRFRVRLCPTVNSTRRGETDAFLLAVDEAGAERGLTRDAIYAGYLSERLAGATVETVRLDGFRLVEMVRKAGPDGFARRRYPEAHLIGTLHVDDPERLLATLATGVGRQRGFGYGMVQLEPAAI